MGQGVERQVDIDDWERFCRLDRLSDHWWSRPGWLPGRRFLTWFVLFEDPALASYIEDIQRHLADFDYLDPVPADGVHMTIQGVAFVDELSDPQIGALVDAARERCATVAPSLVDVGPVNAYSGGVFLRVGPWQPIMEIRDRLRGAASAALPEVEFPVESRQFKPHVSVAYCHREVATEPLRQRLAALRDTPLTTTRITGVTLLELRREERAYRWDTRELLSFKGA